jgi:hypothetical protein
LSPPPLRSEWVLINLTVGSASAVVTFICVLCTLHFAHANFTINVQLYTLQFDTSFITAFPRVWRASHIISLSI